MNDEPLLMASPTNRVYLALGVFPFNPPGTLKLTASELRCEPAPVAVPGAKLEIPLEHVVEARVERWPGLLRLLLPLNVFLLIPFIRRSFAANLTVQTQSRTYHFAVGNPEEWVRALTER